MQGLSLTRRTRRSMMLVAALSVTAVFVIFYLSWTSYVLDSRVEELSTQTRVLAQGFGQVDDVEDPLAEIRGRLFRVEAGLIGATLAFVEEGGATLIDSTGEDPPRDTYPMERLGQPDAQGVRSSVVDVAGIGRVLMVAAPVEGEDPRYVLALKPVDDLNRTRSWVALLLGVSGTAALLVAWSAGGRLAARLSGPVIRLSSGVDAVARGAWGHKVEVEGDDEVAHLAVAFNRMSERVDAAYRSQKEFVGNVSHEMRTPVTTIAGFAGALADGTVTDEATRERYLGVIRDEAVRLGELARVLLSLADLDAGNVEPDESPFSLSDVAAALITRHRQNAEEAEVSLDAVGMTDEMVGDEGLVLQALSILMDNAIRYTPRGGVVRLAYEGASTLVVEDSGPGIPPQDREAVFERFSRLDASRSKEGGGSGLGLAIFSRLVDVMGGRAGVEDSELGGARFWVRLPFGGEQGST